MLSWGVLVIGEFWLAQPGCIPEAPRSEFVAELSMDNTARAKPLFPLSIP
jgi:hypothetical protein